MQLLSVLWLGHAQIMHCGIIFSEEDPTSGTEHQLFKLTNKTNKFPESNIKECASEIASFWSSCSSCASFRLLLSGCCTHAFTKDEK
jgi:hypothetical protein